MPGTRYYIAAGTVALAYLTLTVASGGEAFDTWAAVLVGVFIGVCLSRGERMNRDLRKQRRDTATETVVETVRAGDRLYLALFEVRDLPALEEWAKLWTDAGMEVPRPLSTYLRELRAQQRTGDL